MRILDFSKVFDSTSHRSSFQALQVQEKPAPYLKVLTRLYKGQQVWVREQCQVHAVLQMIMRKVKDKWSTAGSYAWNMEDKLTKLRFADGIILIDGTLPQVKQMIAEMAVAC